MRLARLASGIFRHFLSCLNSFLGKLEGPLVLWFDVYIFQLYLMMQAEWKKNCHIDLEDNHVFLCWWNYLTFIFFWYITEELVYGICYHFWIAGNSAINIYSFNWLDVFFTDVNNFSYVILDFNDLVFVFLKLTMIVLVSLVSLFSVLWWNFKELYNSSFVLWFLVLQYFLYILFLALIDVKMPFVIQGFDCSFFSLLDILWIGAWKESNSLKIFMKLSSYYIIYIMLLSKHLH